MTLENCRILVTRPKPQGVELCERIRAKQGNPLFFPTLEIVPTENMTKAEQQIALLKDYDWLIFTSPQAVYHGVPVIKKQLGLLPDTLRFAAIGGGTLQALQRENISSAICSGKEWSSEGLLDLPELHDIRGKRIAIIKGEGGREKLTESLSLRGAAVLNIAVYQRRMPIDVNLHEYLDLLKKQKIDIIVSASGASMLNLLQMTGEVYQDLLLPIPIVVVSERLVMLAEGMHFRHVFLADNASHDNILKALVTVRNMLGKIYGGHRS